MKIDKAIAKITSTFAELKSLEKELSKLFDATKKDIDRSTKLEFGTRVLRIQGLHKQLVDQIELFLDLELGVLDDLPQEISGYYTTTIELSKPVAETDTEEIKKFKEFINNYKNTDNGDQTIQTT